MKLFAAASRLLSTLALTVLATTALAAEPASTQRVSFVPAGKANDPATLGARAVAPLGVATRYVFSAPPHESTQAAAEIYGPIAEYLTRITGKQVVYRHPANWMAYQADMRKGDYDLVFDDPHFNDWRVANLEHNILVKTSGEHSFVVVVKKDNAKINELKQLAGRAVCGMSPPNLGTLTVLKEFDNPMRQPVIQNTEGWDTVYQNMLAGRCAAAILPTRNFAKFDALGKATRVLYKARAFPNQALSAGLRVTPEDQARIVGALTAIEARLPLTKLREVNALSGDFVPANKSEYLGVANLLKDTWGYQ